MRRSVIATAAVMALSGALMLNVAAQQPDTRDRTILTFSNAVELPGLRLEPGTYVFRLADTASRNVVQVLTQDEMEMLGQWLFVSAERPEVTGDTVITFREASADATPAIQFWYYPGERIGKEFIYPRDQAMRIAQRTGATVMTEEGPVAADASAAVQAEIPPAPAQQEPTVLAQDQGAVDRGAAQAVGTAGVQQPAPTQQAQADQTFARDELPRTASPLGLGALIGLLSLAGAAGIRAFRL